MYRWSADRAINHAACRIFLTDERNRLRKELAVFAREKGLRFSTKILRNPWRLSLVFTRKDDRVFSDKLQQESQALVASLATSARNLCLSPLPIKSGSKQLTFTLDIDSFKDFIIKDRGSGHPYIE